ncbi:MAG: hypothetical protein ACREQY_20950, partial [Candidatus Binatia bacterium]
PSGRKRRLLAGGVLALALASACGGGGGGSAGSTINGNVSTAQNAAAEKAGGHWLARAIQEVIGLGQRAWAQGPGSLEGIRVSARGRGGSASATTREDGGFAISGAPTGDVTTTFSRGNCSSDLVLPAVAARSTVTLEEVELECTSARPGKIAETFQGVVRNKPGSQQGNLVVCADFGDGNGTRAVMVRNAEFLGPDGGPSDFAAVERGDRIEATGRRVGQGAPSTHDADTVQILSSGEPDLCVGEDDFEGD